MSDFPTAAIEGESLQARRSPSKSGDAPPAGLWRRELADAVRDPGELCRLLGLDAAVAADAGPASSSFPLLVPRGFVARMKPGDPRDPLLLQVLPRAVEQTEVAGYTSDPVGESAALHGQGLVRKYAGRVLLLAAGGCAVNCRYCFRREFPYAESGANQAGVDAAVDAIAEDESIREVILSGGDPLLLDDERLGRLVRRLEAVPHVRRLRIHSRLPIVLPSRVTGELVALLGGTRFACVLVVHANHPAELDGTVSAAITRLAESGTLLFNQAVLLAGVNDSVDVLAALSERLIDIGVVPYYLHLLDPVRGAAAFEVAEPRARALHESLRASLPGYAVPTLVRERAGASSKTWLV